MVGIAVILAFVRSATATPEIDMIDFKSSHYDGDLPYANAEGTVFNAGPLKANNVSVIVNVYVLWGAGGRSAHVSVINSTDIEFDTLPINSSRHFSVTISYQKSIQYQFYDVEYGLLYASGFGFGPDFLAKLLPTVVSMFLLNIYIAHRQGFFMWVKARKKVITTTVVWSVAVALVMIKSFWLLYVENPFLVSQGIAASAVYVPTLGMWDFVLLLFVSIIAGAIIVDIEIVVYSFIACVILSFAFALTYASLFVWFILGVGESLSLITPGISFLDVVQSTIQAGMMDVFKMILITSLICLLGVLLGAFLRSYLQPSADIQVSTETTYTS